MEKSYTNNSIGVTPTNLKSAKGQRHKKMQKQENVRMNLTFF